MIRLASRTHRTNRRPVTQSHPITDSFRFGYRSKRSKSCLSSTCHPPAESHPPSFPYFYLNTFPTTSPFSPCPSPLLHPSPPSLPAPPHPALPSRPVRDTVGGRLREFLTAWKVDGPQGPALSAASRDVCYRATVRSVPGMRVTGLQCAVSPGRVL